MNTKQYTAVLWMSLASLRHLQKPIAAAYQVKAFALLLGKTIAQFPPCLTLRLA